MDVNKYSKLSKEFLPLCGELFSLPDKDIKAMLFMILYINADEKVRNAVDVLLDIPKKKTLNDVIQGVENERKKNERVKEK